MDDLAEGESEVLRMARAGHSLDEIIAATGDTLAEVLAELPDALTPMMVKRVHYDYHQRAIGKGAWAPHAQAAQVILQGYMPETYGRQAAAGMGTLRVIVDSGFTLRAERPALEGQTLPAIEPPSGG